MSPQESTSGWIEAAARQGRLIRKELLEILRDRRTIVTLVVMPLLIYPILGVAFVQFFQAVAPVHDPSFIVGSHDRQALAVFHKLQEVLTPTLQASMKDAAKVPVWETRLVESPQESLREGSIDLILNLSSDAEGKRKPPHVLMFETTYLRKSTVGPTAALWLERLVALANGQTLEEILKRPGAPAAVRLTLERHVLASDEGDGLVSLTSVIPFVLILMTITGAVYPAIDLTAGERERGTLEILVAAPVPRLSLLFAKYVAVVFVAVLTALVNLSAMTVTLLINPLGQQLMGPAGLTALLLVQLLALLLLFASFFAAVLLTITSFARSFKEAQAYLIPLMLFSMAPGAAGLVPGLQLTPGFAVTPLVNIVLLGRDLLNGDAQPGAALLVVTATILYAIAALSLAARVFGAEGVLYNERNSWADLFRRPAEVQAAASPSSALWALALMMPLYFVLEWILRQGLPAVPALKVAATAVFSVLLFVGVPAAFARNERVAWRSGFGWRSAPWQTWLIALIWGITLWNLLLPILAWIQGTPSEMRRQIQDQVVLHTRQATLDLRFLFVASTVAMAIVEELFFRGYLWEALARKLSTLATILITAVLFALAHVVTGGALGMERLLPGLLLGLVLGTLRARSGSVLPGMLQHAVHNAILGILSQSRSLTAAVELQHTPLLTAASVGAVIGVLLLALPPRNDAGREPN